MKTYKYGQKLPKKVEKKLDAYIERIKAIKWFKPSPDFKEEDARVLAEKVISSFGAAATVEFRGLKSPEDWDAARGAALDAARGAALDAARDAALDAAWDAALDAARDAALDAARDAARGAAWNAAWDAALDAARDAARGARDELANEIEIYKLKYPDGNFRNLISLYEMGLYPVGVVDGKFIIYVPKQ